MKETHPRPKAPPPRTPRRAPAAKLGTALSSPAHMSFRSDGPRMVSDESNAQINQSKKEAFLRTNIAVKLPAWMIEKQTELLPLSAYSPRRMHHKNQAYATPETGSSSGGSASDPRALHESPVMRKFTSRNLSEYQLAPISPPQGNRGLLREAPRDVVPGESARSQGHDDDGPMENNLSNGGPTTDRHNLQRVNRTQVDRTIASGTADKRVEINQHLAQHVGGLVRDGLARPQATDEPPVVTKPLETHEVGTAIAKSSNNISVVVKPAKMLGEETSMTKSPSKALVVARPRGMRVEDVLQTRSPVVAKLARIPEEEVLVTQSPMAANSVTTNGVEASITQSLTQTPNEALVVVEPLETDEAGTEITQSSNKAPVVTQPMQICEEGPSMTKPPGEAPLVTGPAGTDGEKVAMIQSPAGSWNFRNSMGRKERIVIIIDDDEMEVDNPDSELRNPAQTDDDDTQSEGKGHGRNDVLESGGKSVVGRKCPSTTHQDDEARDQGIPEGERSGELTAEEEMGNEQVHHTGTRGVTPPEAAIEEVREPQGHEAAIVTNPHTRAPIDSSCLSREEISNATNLQEVVHSVQPIVIIIDDDDDEDEEGEKNEDDMESEYYEEIVSPFDLRASVRFSDGLQIPPSSSVSEPSNTSAASTATSEPSIASAASSPRKRIKLSQFTQSASASSAPTPLLKLDRSRWSAPNRAIHRRFSGPMILTPLRITPFPAGLGEVDHSGRSHYPLSDFDLPANTNPKTPSGKRRRRYIGSVKE